MLSRKYYALIAALLITFLYLNLMPSLVHGIYWEPAAITYQLGNCLLLYFIVNCFRLLSVTGQNILLKISTGFLVVFVCGSNETSMLELNLIILVVLFYMLVFRKKIDRLFLGYLFLSGIFSFIMMSSPGNKLRAGSFAFPNSKNFQFTLTSDFSTAIDKIAEWTSSPALVLVSIFAILLYFMSGIKMLINYKKFIFLFLLISISGFLILTAGFSPGFWGTGEIAPDRTINVLFWFFMIVWFSLVFVVAAFLEANIGILKSIRWSYFMYIPLICCFLIIKFSKAGNYLNACKDLTCGKVASFDRVWKKRIELIKNNASDVCFFPRFSRIPNSIFTCDLPIDSSYNEGQYATYFNVNRVKVQPGNPEYVCSYLLNFDDITKGNDRITNKQAFSPPNSCLLDGENTYSMGFDKKIIDLDVDYSAEIANVQVSARFFSSDSIINATMVFQISDTLNKKQFYWTAQDLPTINNSNSKWNKEHFSFCSFNKSIISPANKIVIYLWNKGKGKIFMDDLSVNFY